MKKLEELGISPAPWRICDERCLDGSIVGVESSDKKSDLVAGDIVITEANARLIAAAPELYDALYEAVEEKCTECHQINDYESDIGVEWQMCKGCPVKKWRDALAKASGEEEDNG